MNRRSAQTLIETTFSNPFNEEQFRYFIINLLNEIDENKASIYISGHYIKDSFKNHVRKYRRLGTYTDLSGEKIDVMIIHLRNQWALERSRTTLRNFAASYLKKRGNKDAALIAYHADDQEDWRFSFVRMQYRQEINGSGKVKVKEEFTPARRYSYLVGKNEPNHTAKVQLLPILLNDSKNPSLKEIENAFDIGTVTKEFFLKYRDLFLRTKEELDIVVEDNPKVATDFKAKSVDTVNFTKKLLGQIVFLYFLQKKGWFGVGRDNNWGTGSKQFLRELFEKKHVEYENFFNDIMEPLFYEALRRDRSDDDGYYRLFDFKIPFLNGGLFDPIGKDGGYDWVHTEILIPNTLFSNNNKTKEGDTGDGILDIFDRYNFTVKEDEPLEKEVAIDPELLGKAYEKFNAIRPDNYDEFKKALKSGKKGEENKFNKKFGVYYTPREIVHYMCQQSLINYLYTQINKGAISYQKIGDNQTDMLGNKVKKGQLNLTGEQQPNPIINRIDIENLIHFGEHISENEQRVISKGKETKTYSHKLPESIRNNAALIDEKLADITVCDPAVGSGAFPVGMMHEIVKTRNVLSNYIKDPQRTIYNFKRECIEKSLYGVDIDPGAVEITKLRLWLSLVVDEEDIRQIKPLPNLDYKIVRGNSLLGVEKNLFNNQLFTEMEHLKPIYFDETNPTKKQEYKKQIDELISQITNGHIEFDFEVYFSEVFHKKGGFDVVIGNPPYGRYTGISSLLKNKFKEYDIYGPTSDLAEFFIRKVLNNLLCKYGLLTFIVPKGLSYVKSWREMRKILLYEHNLFTLIDVGKSFDVVLYEMLIFILQKDNKSKFRKNITTGFISGREIVEIQTHKDILTEDVFYFGFPKCYYNILEKVKSSCKPISKYVEHWYGKGGMTPYINMEKRGIPVLTGKEIRRYYIADRKYGRWYLEKQYLNNNDLKRANCEKVVVQDIVAHITKPYPHIKITAALDYDNRICLNTVMCFSRNSSISNIFLVGLLNSKFISFYYYYFVFNQAIRTMHFMPGYADALPIPLITKELNDKINMSVRKVMKIKNDNSSADTITLETEIDQMVYQLYGLTEEEIRLIEESVTVK